jgi:RIO-like serine/threonine protein kinase
MKNPFHRKDIAGIQYRVLSRGRWANADIYLCRHDGIDWVIKDFMPCALIVRLTWGWLMVRREFAALKKLQGIPGVPKDPFKLDSFALGYRYIEGGTLGDTSPEAIQEDFFFKLEDIVSRMHALNLAHLDIRNRRNILVDAAGEPALLDFQNCVNLENTPWFLKNLFKEIDLSGVYKNWEKYKPGSLDSARREKLDALNRKRAFWIFKGYPSWMKGDRRS